MSTSGWKLRYNLGKTKDRKSSFGKAGRETGNETAKNIVICG